MRRRYWNAARRKATTDTTQGTLLASPVDSAESRGNQLGTIPERLGRACDFMHRTARLLDRHLFAHLFDSAPSEPVIDTLRAYRNADVGCGNALEGDKQ